MLAETVDTDLLAHVELVRDRSSTDVEPVVIIWGKFLLASSLNELGPLLSIILIRSEIRQKQTSDASAGEVSDETTYVRHLDLVSLLEMRSEYFDELVGWDVFHSVYVSVKQR